MKKIGKLLHAWLSVNLFAVLPLLWVVVWYAPTRIEMTVEAPHGLTVKIGAVGQNGPDFTRCITMGSAEGQTKVWVYFNDEINTEDLVFSFGEEKLPYKLKSIVIRRHCVFLENIIGEAFVKYYVKESGTWLPGANVLSGWTGSFETGFRIPTLAVLVEIVLLLFSALTFLFGKEERGSRAQRMIVAVAAAAFFCVILPLQTYLGNRDVMDFTFGEFWAEAIVLSVVAGVFFYVALSVLERYFGCIFRILLVAALVCAYLETGVLSIGMPPLNGDVKDFRKAVFSSFDSLILTLVFVVLLATYCWSRRFVHWVALAILILGVASLCDVHAESGSRNDLSAVGELVPKIDIAKNAVFSIRRNVIMFILDTVPSYAAWDAIEAEPELKSKFPGFVAYNNNIGMGDFTETGLPGIMTGRYYATSDNMVDFRRSVFTSQSFLAPYIAAGCPVMFIPMFYDNAGGALCNAQVRKRCKTIGRRKAPFSRPSKSTDAFSLRDIVRVRLTPHRFKVQHVIVLFKGCDGHYGVEREQVLYPLIAQAKINYSCGLSLHVYHTQGCHPPVEVDGEGRRLSAFIDKKSYACILGQTKYSLRCLALLLDRLRDLGLYDCSSIVVCSDHGCSTMRDNRPVRTDEVPVRAHALLWVKPEDACQPISSCDIPTSHSKIFELMRTLRETPLKSEAIRKMLQTESREYRACGKSWFIDSANRVTFLR